MSLFSKSGKPWREELVGWGWTSVFEAEKKPKNFLTSVADESINPVGNIPVAQFDTLIAQYSEKTLLIEWKGGFGARRTVGKLSRIPDTDGLYLVESLDGKIALLDPTALDVEAIYFKRGVIEAEERRALTRSWRYSSEPSLDLFFKKRSYCSAVRRLESSVNGKTARKIARNLVSRANILPSVVAFASCMGLAQIVDPYIQSMQEARQVRDWHPTWFGNHGSNSAGGLAYMGNPLVPLASVVRGDGLGGYPAEDYLGCAFFAGFTGVMGGKFYRGWVGALAAGAIAANVWEEVRIPGLDHQISQEQFSSGGKEVHTDWADFASGAGTAVAYWLYHESLLRLEIDLTARFCR